MLPFFLGVVEPWEALVTFSFFFAVIATAYLADKKLFYKKLYRFRRNRKSLKLKSRKKDVRSVAAVQLGLGQDS